MKTYLVRTIEDQVLIGLFCARSVHVLKTTISPMIEPEECEYLVLKDQEGLFVEAQFLTAPSELTGSEQQVYLTNAPESFCSESVAGLEPVKNQGKETKKECQDNYPENLSKTKSNQELITTALKEALAETLPPVLEPTEALSARFNKDTRHWMRFSDKNKTVGNNLAPVSTHPILVLTPSKIMH